jgi:hypothetical protein
MTNGGIDGEFLISLLLKIAWEARPDDDIEPLYICPTLDRFWDFRFTSPSAIGKVKAQPLHARAFSALQIRDGVGRVTTGADSVG